MQDLFAVDGFFWNNLTNPGGSDPAAPPPFFNVQTQWIDIEQLSQELKLVSPTDQSFSYVVGLFYSDTKVDLHYQRELIPAFLDFRVRPQTKTTDLYGRGTWKLSDATSVVAGLRYNYDEVSYRYDKNFFPPFLPSLQNRDSANESTVVGDLSLQHRFADESMAYFSYARGYGPAAFNTAYVEYADDDPGTVYTKDLDLVKKEDGHRPLRGGPEGYVSRRPAAAERLRLPHDLQGLPGPDLRPE